MNCWAIPALLEQIAIEGYIITIDAMGCQYEIADKIVKKGADYVFSLKGNQGTLHEGVKEYWDMLDFTKPAAQASPLKFRTITHRFGGEGRYTLLLRPREPEPEAPEKHRRPAGLDPQKFYVYAVEADLFRLRPWVPWVGDMDVHSFHSDGREILDIHSRAA